MPCDVLICTMCTADVFTAFRKNSCTTGCFRMKRNQSQRNFDLLMTSQPCLVTHLSTLRSVQVPRLKLNICQPEGLGTKQLACVFKMMP